MEFNCFINIDSYYICFAAKLLFYGELWRAINVPFVCHLSERANSGGVCVPLVLQSCVILCTFADKTRKKRKLNRYHATQRIM